MSVIDTSQWKEFRIGDLFEVIRGRSQTMRMLEEGNTPLIAAARANQGVAGYYDVSPEYSDSITVSCNGVGCGSVFYHDGPFSITGDASVMKEKQTMSRASKLFIAAICDLVFSEKYSYAEKCNPAGLLEEKVNLPATTSGDPDWAYMDSFMGKILEEEEVAAEQLAALAPESEADGHFLDVSWWKAFHLYDIFHIDMGNKFDRGKMPIGDEINFVGRTGLNNGINATCGAVDKVVPYPPGLITLALGGTIGACFVQPKKFYTSQNVIVLNPKQKLSFAVKTFISAIIWRVSDMYYDAFSNELNRHIKTDFVFWLPVTSDGQPDWAWMEQYMQQQLDKTEKLAEHLNELNLQKH